MRRAALATLLSHWRRHPGQLATLVIGLALATALWSAVQAINAEARASYDRAAGTLDQGGTDRLTRPGGRIALETYVALRRAGWRVTPVLEGTLRGEEGAVTVIGLDFLTAPEGALPEAPGPGLTPGEIFLPPGVAFAAPDTTLAGADLPRLVPSEQVPPGRLVTDIATAERLLQRADGIDRLLVLPDQPPGLPPLAEIAPELERSAPPDRAELGRMTRSFHLNLTAFGLLSFAVGLFIVHGAVGLALEQRRATFRTLRAIGLPARTLTGLLLAELALLALAAGGLGVALGYVLAGLLLPDVAATLRGLYGAAVPGTLSFDPVWALSGLAIALAGTAAAAAHGLTRVARMPLLASARPRAWATVSAAALRRQAAAGALLLAAGGTAPLVADGLVAGFALLGGLLVGAALILPLVLAAALGLGARRARSALAEWFWADARQQLPGLSLALMALLLALATNIGVGTMVGSFRATFTGWLDQRLAAELYVQVPDAAAAERLRAVAGERGADVLPIVAVDGRPAGAPGEIFGIVDHPTYRRNWPLLSALPDVWDRVAAGEAALVNEQIARRAGLSPGDPVTLEAGWRLPVAGIYSDYGNPQGQALVALDALRARHPGVEARNFGLRSDRPEALADALRARAGLPDAAITDQAALKALSLSIFERTFAVTGALNVLTLAVAAFAIFTALTTLAAMRLPQLAPVWALGLTRRRLARLEVIRALTLALLTFAAALPVGLALAWALLAVVNVEAFGWRLPLRLFPLQWLWLLAAALAAAAVATALPVRRLARTPPAAFLKVFADER